MDVQRVLLREITGALEAVGLDDISAAGAVGERAGLFEKPAIAERLQEIVMRRDERGVEVRLAHGEHEIFHGGAVHC